MFFIATDEHVCIDEKLPKATLAIPQSHPDSLGAVFSCYIYQPRSTDKTPHQKEDWLTRYDCITVSKLQELRLNPMKNHLEGMIRMSPSVNAHTGKAEGERKAEGMPGTNRQKAVATASARDSVQEPDFEPISSHSETSTGNSKH